jgi:MATE family multidrug resistance protein
MTRLGRLRDGWTRPCGGREVLQISLPLVISTISTTLMIFVDRMFLLWYSPEAMAAAMPAGMFHFTVISFPMGVALYVNTFVAQYEGAGRPRQIGPLVWQGIWIGVLAAPLLMATSPWVATALTWANRDQQLAGLEATFYRVLTFGSGAMIIAAAQVSFFTGRGKTRVVMCVDTTATLLNAVLDYAWIFGHLGFSAGGIAGAAWATTTAEWFRVLAYGGIMFRPANIQTYQWATAWRPNARLMGRLWRYGGPGGLQTFMEVAAFTVFLILVGRLGEVPLAATTLAFTINNVAWVPMWGLGTAVTAMVGQQLGQNRADLAARATWTALGMALAYMGTMAVLYVTVPDWFLKGHAAGTSPATFGPLRDLTVVLLRFVAAYCLFDALNVVFVSAIRGAGDMRFILLTTLVMSPPPLLAAWWGIARQGWGLLWCWSIITVWICSLGLIYLVRFLQGRWREMRVIEPEATSARPQREEG